MKLKEAQEKIEQTKIRLDSVLIDETSSNATIDVTVTGNGYIKNIRIHENDLSGDELEDYLVITLNNALKRATEIRELELANAAKDVCPTFLEWIY